MIVWTAAQRPVILALPLVDWKVVDARNAKPHQAMFVEFPIFVAIAAEPMPAVVMPLIGKAHSDTVVAKGPDFLDQTVVEFTVPLACQERLDCSTTLEEFRAVSPPAVGRVGQRNASGVARVPGVLRHTRLLGGGVGGKRRKRRTIHGVTK